MSSSNTGNAAANPNLEQLLADAQLALPPGHLIDVPVWSFWWD